MKPVSTQEYKETIKALLAFVKTIAPQLEQIAKNREFELVITNDENGIGMSCSMGWDPTMDGRKPLEAEDIDGSSLRIDEEEKELIRRALEISGGNIKEAAARLGFSERTLHRKVREYRLK